ncbi:MAG: glycosyltransferase [Candidatus Kapaibacteriota bacterium]
MPFPLIGGDRIKSYKLLSYLSKKHNITLVTFYQGKENYNQYKNEIEKLGVKVYVIPLNPIVAGLNSLFRLYQFKPLEILYYYQKSYQKLVDDLLRTKKFDIAFSFFMRTADYLKGKDIPKILIAEDCRYLYQTRSYSQSNNLIQKAVRKFEYLTLSKYEPNTVDYFDLITFVTNEDIDYINNIKPLSKYRLLTNGTDIEHFKPLEFEKRDLILFTGKLDYWLNKLMINRLINSIIPKIQKEFPSAMLTVVGAKAPNFLKELSQKGKIQLHENVPDLLPYLQRARVYLHPHIGASGIQNKLLEAMSAGCPIVTTESGNQGIYGKHREHLLIGETDDEIANYAIELLKDNELAKKISANARQLIIETHNWDIIYEKLDEIIKEIKNE